ncbi:MAG: ribonuclease HII [Burkholderiales bacterium]|nr:ribonuclease HII [Opitutaceae bacterium]
MSAKRRQLRAFDLKHLDPNPELIGVDEAGRGALAGPVVAAAVLVTRPFLESRWADENARRINDSKQLTAAERDALYLDFEALANEGHIHAQFGSATVEEIETQNILGATKLAMRRALEAIYPPSAFAAPPREPDLFSSAEEVAAFRPPAQARILVDGLALRNFPYPHVGVVQGDGRSLCIAMASIIAKVTRDRMMTELDAAHPGYGFARHKGYGTLSHAEALTRLGPCACHRASFSPVTLALEAQRGPSVALVELPLIDLVAPEAPYPEAVVALS